MSPPREPSAERDPASLRRGRRGDAGPAQRPEEIAQAISDFCDSHPSAALLEDGKVIFDLRAARFTLSTEHGRCTLQLWSEDRNLVRRVVAATPRGNTLRLDTLRFGHSQSKLLELVADRERRTPSTLEATRERYVHTVERILLRQFPDWKAEGLRTARDLEKSFGPAYTRGSLVRGNLAWAIIGVNQEETTNTVDGILTLGILWLHECRERAGGRRLYQGLKLLLPQGRAQLTLARLAWMNHEAAQWELWEFEEQSEELTQRELNDQGNLRTRLIHRPDEAAAAERFAAATEQVMQLVPAGEADRVELRLRSTAEMAYLLHGLEFARARIALVAHSFAHALEITVGSGREQLPLTPAHLPELQQRVAELFERRRPPDTAGFTRSAPPRTRRIGAPSLQAAHAKLNATGRMRPLARGVAASSNDPLYRTAPERWLESVLRRDLAPLTRSLAPPPADPTPTGAAAAKSAVDLDPDTLGNRLESLAKPVLAGPADAETGRVIPRLDPHHVYAQVPAIAGASDRGLLDLLGVTADGRLAVIELKADDDLHFALQGLDYWIRVRHHHRQSPDSNTGLGEFQRHGYFRGVELSPLPPRLYLVAPALHIHPATEMVLRYLSPKVEWNLLALDERWRQKVRVVWRKQGGRGESAFQP